MTIDARLKEIIEHGGAWTSAYVDGSGSLPQVEEEARERAVRDRLVAEGAPKEDAVAVERALAQRNGIPSPSARIVFASGGEIAFDESFADGRRGPERLSHGPLPVILPVLRHAAGTVRYLVVETSRDSADIRLEAAARGAETHTSVEGDSDDITKVQAGGWSHANFQRSAENTWKRNQTDIAGTVSELIRDEHPAFVAVAGDVRARQLLVEALSGAERELVIDIDVHTHAEGADRTEFDEAVARAVEQHVRDDVERIRDRAATDSGSGGAEGVSDVVAALQQARVDTLLLDNRMLDDDSAELLALDAPPWVAADPSESLGAATICRLPAPEALARAAVLTDARVVIEEDEPQAGDAPREDRAVRQPIASLRWADTGGAGNDR